MVKILVFDTETTGLEPYNIDETKLLPNRNENGKWETWKSYNDRLKTIKEAGIKESKALKENPKLWETYKDNWPYTVQISFIMYDSDTKETVVRDIYIDIPPKFTTSEYLSTVHPITRQAIEAGQAEGIERQDIREVISEFMTYFRSADVITGHNVDFDINMLLAECARTEQIGLIDEIYATKLLPNKIYCTACESTDFVKICFSNNCSTKPPIFKKPKLKEAYYRMFGYPPKEGLLHNSLIDVVVCLRVFYRLWFLSKDSEAVCGIGQPDIYLELLVSAPENEIVKIIEEITPAGIDPKGLGTELHICDIIDNNTLEAQMTGAEISDIIEANEKKKRLSRYISITGNDPFSKFKAKGGTKKNSRKKNSRKKRKSRKSRKIRRHK